MYSWRIVMTVLILDVILFRFCIILVAFYYKTIEYSIQIWFRVCKCGIIIVAIFVFLFGVNFFRGVGVVFLVGVHVLGIYLFGGWED